MKALVYTFAVDGTCGISGDAALYKIDATSATRTRTFPDATLCRGLRITVIKVDASANAVTVNTTSAQNITGVGGAVTSKSLAAQGNSLTVVSDGTGWIVVGTT